MEEKKGRQETEGNEKEVEIEKVRRRNDTNVAME